MLIEQGAVRVGMEIEVASWKNTTFHEVAKSLIEAGYMQGAPEIWTELHTYRCKCDVGGCRIVRSGSVVYPPLVSLTYDASLPVTGGEFVTTPILLGNFGLEALKDIWNIVTDDAVWTNKLKDKNGEMCSPSIHLHVSSNLKAIPPSRGSEYIPSSMKKDTNIDDCTHALSLFAPEFIALASVTGLKRGLTYRKPIRHADQNGHHGFVHVRRFNPGVEVYIEWRMFEAAYDSWEYVESTALVAALITRGLNKPNMLGSLMAEGYSDPIDPRLLNESVRNDDTEMLLKLVSNRRLNFLRDLCMTETVDDDIGKQLVPLLFDKAMMLYGN